MADEEIPQELDNLLPDEFLPYDLEFLYTASSAYTTILGIDPGLLSKTEQKKLAGAKEKLLAVIIASTDKIHKDYFGD